MRLLLIGKPDAVYTARWLGQIMHQGWDIHFFPVYLGLPHQKIRNITFYHLSSYRPPALDSSVRLRGLWPLPRGGGFMRRAASRVFPAAWLDSAFWLARIIQEIQPDVVHALELSPAGWLTLAARHHLGGKFPPWIVSTWHTDWYQEPFSLPEVADYVRGATQARQREVKLYWQSVLGVLRQCETYARQVQGLQAICDVFHSDYAGDVAALQQFGYNGINFTQLAFPLDHVRQAHNLNPPSQRRMIVLRGLQTSDERALVGLRAIERCASLLTDYRIVVILPHSDVVQAAQRLAYRTDLQIDFATSGYDEIVQLYGHARVTLELYTHNLVSLLLPESLVMGAYPICPAVSRVRQWIADEDSGLLVDPEDPQEIASALHRAVTDDALVDRAAQRHLHATTTHQQQIVAMYTQCAATPV